MKIGAFVPQGWRMDLNGVAQDKQWQTILEAANKIEKLNYESLWTKGLYLNIIGLFLFMLIKGLKNQLPLLITILLMQIFIALNFWRYVLTNSPGETSINAITFNALIFSLSGFSMFLLLLRQKND